MRKILGVKNRRNNVKNSGEMLSRTDNKTDYSEIYQILEK